MIQSNPFKREIEELKKEYLDACQRTLESGWYILGEEVVSFEKQLSEIQKVNHAIGCASGMAKSSAFGELLIEPSADFLILSLRRCSARCRELSTR